jgi:hypothetical protein
VKEQKIGSQSICQIVSCPNCTAWYQLIVVFDEIHFTGAFQHLEATKEEEEGHAAKRAFVSHTKRSKAKVSLPLSFQQETND